MKKVISSDWLIAFSVWRTSEVFGVGAESFMWIIVIRALFVAVLLQTAVWYGKQRVWLMVVAAMGMSLYILACIFEAYVRTAPQLTWGTLTFYVFILTILSYPPLRQLVLKNKERIRREKREVLT